MSYLVLTKKKKTPLLLPTEAFLHLFMQTCLLFFSQTDGLHEGVQHLTGQQQFRILVKDPLLWFGERTLPRDGVGRTATFHPDDQIGVRIGHLIIEVLGEAEREAVFDKGEMGHALQGTLQLWGEQSL